MSSDWPPREGVEQQVEDKKSERRSARHAIAALHMKGSCLGRGRGVMVGAAPRDAGEAFVCPCEVGSRRHDRHDRL